MSLAFAKSEMSLFGLAFCKFIQETFTSDSYNSIVMDLKVNYFYFTFVPLLTHFSLSVSQGKR